jgi:hypothetical protein
VAATHILQSGEHAITGKIGTVHTDSLRSVKRGSRESKFHSKKIASH